MRANGSEARKVWMHEQPCAVCGWHRTEIAHVGNGGAGRKSDAKFTVPLCAPRQSSPVYSTGRFVEGCHRESHRIGIKTFAAKYGIDLKAEAARIDALWQAHSQRGE